MQSVESRRCETVLLHTTNRSIYSSQIQREENGDEKETKDITPVKCSSPDLNRSSLEALCAHPAGVQTPRYLVCVNMV